MMIKRMTLKQSSSFYKQGDPFSKYNLADQNSEEYSDFIRKKWLNNDFYGVISTVYGKLNAIDVNFGVVANQYYGRHYGEVSGVYFPQIQNHEYYRNRSVKNEMAGFAKAIFKLNKFEIFGDLQLRNIDYDTKILTDGDYEGANLDKNWIFFNPKAGVSYQIEKGKLYFSYANAHREPNRDDLIANSETEAESLHDFEAGVEKTFGKIQLAANLYYMYYVNQLVLNGQINNVGEFIRSNLGKSYRVGLEISAIAKISEQFNISGNLALSENKSVKQTVDVKIQDPNNLNNEIIIKKEIGGENISFSPNIIGNLLLNYQPLKNLSFGIQNQYVGSQYLDNTDSENLQLPSYYLMDFNAKYSLNFEKVGLDFKFLLNNILNKKYVNNGYVWDGPIYFSQAGTNFMFGVSIMTK